MKVRNILVNGLLLAATVFLIGCSDFSTDNVNAFGNQTWFDTNWTFNEAIINEFDEVKHVNVQQWCEYEGSDAIQIVASDGTVYYTTLNNCVLINK